MNYELLALEELIIISLHPAKLKTEHLGTFLPEQLQKATNEAERIKKHFVEVVIRECQHDRIVCYFQQHQRGLVRLCNSISDFLQVDSSNSVYNFTKQKKVIDFYKSFLSIPESILDFILMHFPEYFDQECGLPDHKRSMSILDFDKNIGTIKNALHTLEVSEILVGLIAESFEKLFDTNKSFSYHDINYLKILYNELTSFIGKAYMANANGQLCRLLLFMNFNSFVFFEYYISMLQETAVGFYAINDLLEFYSLKLKMINQLPVKPLVVYDRQLNSNKEQIGSWISEEIYFLEKRQNLLLIPNESKSEIKTNEKKVHTRLSVSQLALAVKLLVDSKLFTNKNATELMRMVARNFRTDRQEIISEDSLRNKSYQIESSTADKLKDEIIGLMNMVRKY